MSDISQSGRKTAMEKYGVRLLPPPGESSQELATSVTWGPFHEGDYISISLNYESFIATGDGSVVASVDDVLLPADVHDFVVPAGVTHIALFSTVSFAGGAIWRS